MHRLSLAAAVAAIVVSLGLADDTLKTPSLPTPKAADTKAAQLKPLDEVWEAAFVPTRGGADVKIGHIHMTSVPVTVDEARLVRTTKELRLVVNRGGAAAELKADSATDEDAGGKVRGLRGKIWLGADRVQVIEGKVIDGPVLRITADGFSKYQSDLRWDPEVVGLAREQTLLRDRKVKPGDKFSYRTFEPMVSNYMTVQVAVHDKESTTLPGGVKRDLLRVVATPDPLKLKDGQILQMPAGTFWADPATLDVVKTDMEIPAIGKVVLVRTSKAAALLPNGRTQDINETQSIYFPARIPDLHDRNAVVYRVTYTGGATPKELVAADARQAIRNAAENTFELAVTARRKPEGEGTETAGPEYLRPNYMLNSADPEVVKLAKQAAGPATDPWDKARRIEHWVRQNMRTAAFTEALAPADHVAKTLTGDCTEFAMLTAAMCKAQGVPARTAIGLVYVDNLGGRPGLGFHMWTEVFVRGQWLALDATLGRGSIGAGHIKINDHSWDGVMSLTPLLPVQGFLMAKPKIEVVGK